MAIQAITGVMGSGKSYELVSEHIVKTLKTEPGRRFVTNVEGLNYEALASFCGLPLDEVRQRLVSVSYERVAQPGFWYDPEGGQTDTVVQPGDVVGLDEIWRYFNQGSKLPEDAMRFFRMHRHYSSEVHGYTCDVVLVNQSFRGIHKDIRDVVEVQYNCRKLKVLGRPDNYQVFVIEGGERKSSHDFLRKYKKEIFPLYSSYTNSSAKEVVDKRQSVFSKGFFKYVIPVFIVLSIGCGYYVYTYLKSGGQPGKSAAQGASQPLEAPKAPAGGVPPLAPPVASSSSEAWRVVAVYRVNSVPVFVLVNSDGVYRKVAGIPSETAGFGEIYGKLPPDKPGYVSPFSGSFNQSKGFVK